MGRGGGSELVSVCVCVEVVYRIREYFIGVHVYAYMYLSKLVYV